MFGVLRVAAGIGSIADGLGHGFVAGYSGVVSRILVVPSLLGALRLAAWPLVKGVRVPAERSVSLRSSMS